MQQRCNFRRTVGRVRLPLCCTILCSLLACQPSGPEAPLDAYLAPLGAAPSLQPPDRQTGSVILPPLIDSLQLDIAASGLERFDVLALSGCAVQGNIIRRDTSLGRLAKPSQQLMLALDYLHLAPPCIAHLRGHNDALADHLHNAWQQQQAQLPALIFNATLGGDEYRAFWLAAPVPGEYPRVDACETTSALNAIEVSVRRWLGGDYRAQDRDLELWLTAVAGGAGGKLLHPIAALEAQLDAVLPPRYRSWMEDRNQHFIALVAAPHGHLQPLDQEALSCTTD